MATAAIETTLTGNTLHAHLVTLRANCDGAQARDGQGFSKFDRALGHRLADTPPDGWSDSDARRAAALVAKYHAQLGIDRADVPTVQHGQEVRLYVYPKESRFSLALDFAAQQRKGTQGCKLGEVVRALPTRTFNPAAKTWDGPLTQANAAALLLLCAEFGVVCSALSEQTLSAIADAVAPIEAQSAAPIAPNGKRIVIRDSTILVEFPYNPDDVEAVRTLRDTLRAGQWDVGKKVWVFPLSPRTITALEILGYTHGFDVTALSAWRAERAAESAALQMLADKAAASLLARLGDLSAPLPSGRRLFPFQRDGVEWLAAHPRAILADGMGCGKTTEALVAAKAYAPEHVILVVCPASLRTNWLREAEACGVAISVHSWAKLPAPLEATPYVVIADEAHYAQSVKSQRTKSFLDLAASAQAVWCLTGTPIKNGRPTNLWPLLVATKHPLASDRKGYEIRYCGAHATRWTRWDVTGAAHLDELHGQIKSHMLRRTKAEVLQDLPAKTRVKVEAEPNADELKAYRARLAELRAEYGERVKAGEIQGDGQALVFLSHLRQCGSLAKVSSVVALAEDILEEGSSVVIFTETLATVAALRVALMSHGVSVLTGDTLQDMRQVQVDRFQGGENRVFLGTIRAGGVGLTLTAANHVILVDRPWTPGDAEQAEDRTHRIGQHTAVTAHWMQLRSGLGLDVEIDALLEKKQERIDLVLAGKRKSLKGVESVSSAASELVNSLLG
jgi:hypothetical protein